MKKLSCLTLILALASPFAAAQTITGAFTGTLADPSGAVIPNAKVIATNTGTNIAYSAQSNEAGVYNLLFLPIGSYNLAAEVKGFKKGTAGPFSLQVNQVARVDFKSATRRRPSKSLPPLRFSKLKPRRPANRSAPNS
jgi:hypothetical protein